MAETGYGAPGFAGRYDRYRPCTPQAILDLLCQTAQAARPELVVDLGCGTGHSTEIWAARAESVLGIEINPAMHAVAAERASRLPKEARPQYRIASSSATELPDGCADIVTCSQSFHWMEPEPTLREVARILRPGGVFAAYDHDWPPTVQWEVEAAFQQVMQFRQENADRAPDRSLHAKEKHLGRLRDSGHFRYVREALIHSVEPGNAERIVGLVVSLGSVADLLAVGLTEEELGIDRLRETARRVLGDESAPFWFHYRVRLAVK
jgi:SAM-dependent methyltransferase